MDQVKFFKGCLSQVLLGPFLNTLSHMIKKFEWFTSLNSNIHRYNHLTKATELSHEMNLQNIKYLLRSNCHYIFLQPMQLAIHNHKFGKT